ncbi:MAG: D-amino acid aminotransferase [Clostridia bacterium]|nr:D-amino acid aminotransferase [Clostridia bacterium]
MKDLGYYNGKYDLIDNMVIPMNDRVCYFGDGVYEATYSRNHNIYVLDAHIDRFYRSAEKLKMVIPHTKEELKEILRDLVKKVDDGEQFVYWQLTRGTATRNHIIPDPPMPGNLWVILRPLKVKDTYKKIKVITMPDTRFLHCDIKTLNLIPAVMASTAADRAGCYETVFHRDGRVTECAHSNVHIIKDGVFRTAPTDNLILPGIARANLIRFCGQLGIPVCEEPFSLDEMMAADEIIVSSSSAFCLAVEEIDGKPVGGKAPEILKSLQDIAVEDFTKATDIKA